MSLNWTEYQAIRVGGKERTNVAWWVNDKLKLNKFLVENKIPTPEITNIWDCPQDIALDNVSVENFVLKPSNMHSSAGVMVLQRVDQDRYFDSLSNKYFSVEQIIIEQNKIFEKCRFKNSYKVFVEEKVVSSEDGFEIPLDYKLFCFYGKPLMVFQFNRNTKPKQAAWFDGEFNSLDIEQCITSNWKMIELGDNILPANHEEMIEVAAKTSLLVESPFMSVDMYSSLRGPLVGELTPAPGGPFYGDMYKFTNEFDAKLGKAWEEAVNRMP